MSSRTPPTNGTASSRVRYDRANWRRPDRRTQPNPTAAPATPAATWPGARSGYPAVHDAPTIEVPVVVADAASFTAERWLGRSAALASATRAVSRDARSIAGAGTVATMAAAGAVVLGGGRVLLRLAETALRALHRLVPLAVTAAVLAGLAHLVPWERIRPLAADAAHFVAGRVRGHTSDTTDRPAIRPADAAAPATTAPTAPPAPEPAAPPVLDDTPSTGTAPALVTTRPELPYGVGPLTPEVAARVRPGMTLAEVTRTIGLTADYAGYLPGQLALLPAALRAERDDPTGTATWDVRNWTADGFSPCQLLVTFRNDRAVHLSRSGPPPCPQGANP